MSLKDESEQIEESLYELLQVRRQQNELKMITELNKKTEKFGLVLSTEAARELMEYRNDSLKEYQRVEFGEGILGKLIFAFCDSDYIEQEDYADTLKLLQDIFYAMKNDTRDKLSDDEIITFMKERFESVCDGDTDYLEDLCFQIAEEANKAGFKDFKGFMTVYENKLKEAVSELAKTEEDKDSDEN